MRNLFSPFARGSQRAGLEPATSSLTWIRVKIAGFVSSRQSFFFLRALSYWAISVNGRTSGFEPETSRPLFAWKLLSVTHQVIFFAFFLRSTNWAMPTNTVSGTWTHIVMWQKFLRLPCIPIPAWPHMVHRLVRSMYRLCKNSANNTNSYFTPQVSTFYCLRLTLCSFCQLVPVKEIVGTAIKFFSEHWLSKDGAEGNRTPCPRTLLENTIYAVCLIIMKKQVFIFF